MDISYLLFLQELREATNGVLDGFFSYMTTLGEAPLILLVLCVFYLCVDKALGTYVLMGWGLNRLANGFIKITACVLRPWIRDPRVTPLESALAKATGYSFPSGHTTNAISIIGGPALRPGTRKGLRMALLLIVCLVGLSRNWLGVHTPQDVIVALVVGTLLMLVAQKACEHVEAHPEHDATIAAAGIAISVALIAYAALKSYPLEYDAAGNLLVDPTKMAIDSYKNAGWALGFFVGWFLERRYVGFSVEGTASQKVCRGLWGGLGVLILYYPIADLIKLALPGGVGSAIGCALETLFIVLVMPAIIKHVEGKDAPALEAAATKL